MAVSSRNPSTRAADANQMKVEYDLSKPIFVPLLDNGNASVMADFMMDHGAAFAGREIHMVRASDSLATRGMNKICNAFLDSPCDLWINIDADIRFTKENIDRLLSHNLPLVYGIYPKKSDDCPPCVCTFAEVPVPDSNGLSVVRRAGRGFMLVHRALVEAMKEENGGPALRYHNHEKVEWDFFPSAVVEGDFSYLGNEREEYFHITGDGKNFAAHTLRNGPKREFLSEDWMWCERARMLGVPTYVDTQIALGHVGLKEYRFRGEQITNVDVSRVKSWRDMEGWFDYEDVYRHIAKEIPDGGKFIEVGCWLGKSIAAFAEFTKETGKQIEIHVVDTFEGKPANAHQEAVLAVHGGNVRKMFEANMEAVQLRPIVHCEDSVKAAEISLASSNGIFDAVFIDADHSEEAVYADICAWARHVKKGGILAGHDIDEIGVKQAVLRFFGTEYETVGRCWMVKW